MWKFLDREVSSPTQRVPIQIQIELMQKCCNPYQIDFFLFQSVNLNSFFIDVLYLWALISWWMILFLKIVNDNKSFFVCISEKLNTSKLMKIATLPIVPTWDSSRTRLRLWMMQQLEWSLLSFYSFFLPSSIFGLLCQVIKHSNVHSLWPITRKNCLCISYGSYTICFKVFNQCHIGDGPDKLSV